MITDLRLQKYLEGLLSKEETEYVEAQLSKSEEWQARLEVLQNKPQVFARPIWQRVLMHRKQYTGSKMRFNSVMPILLLIVILVAISGHWFAKPGSNSTFILQDGNASSLELIYNSAQGWHYFDANFSVQDSLSFSIHDSGSYYVQVLGVYEKNQALHTFSIWEDSSRAFVKADKKPEFALLKNSKKDFVPKFFLLVYDRKPLPHWDEATLLQWLTTKSSPRMAPFLFQIFHVGNL